MIEQIIEALEQVRLDLIAGGAEEAALGVEIAISKVAEFKEQ